MTVYLIRHGKDDDTVRGGWSGHGLTPAGAAQARALAEEIAAARIHPACIYSSDLPRAAETAEILSRRLGCPIEYLPALREVDNGVLAGMKNDAAEKSYPGLYWSALDDDQCYPGGESPAQFFARIKAAWLDLKGRAAPDTLVVTHGGVIEAILCVEHEIACSNKAKRFSVPHAALVPVELPSCKQS